MFQKWTIFGIVLLSLLFVSAVSAAGITAKVGETWIRWEWTATQVPANVVVDGTLRELNGTNNYYYLQNIGALEPHTIRIYNSSNVSELWQTSTVTTLNQKWSIFVLIAVLLVLVVFLAWLKNPPIIVLLGAVIIAIALYTSGISTGYGGLYMLPVLVMIGTGAYVVWSLWQSVKGGIAWY